MESYLKMGTWQDSNSLCVSEDNVNKSGYWCYSQHKYWEGCYTSCFGAQLLEMKMRPKLKGTDCHTPPLTRVSSFSACRSLFRVKRRNMKEAESSLKAWDLRWQYRSHEQPWSLCPVLACLSLLPKSKALLLGFELRRESPFLPKEDQQKTPSHHRLTQ